VEAPLAARRELHLPARRPRAAVVVEGHAAAARREVELDPDSHRLVDVEGERVEHVDVQVRREHAAPSLDLLDAARHAEAHVPRHDGGDLPGVPVERLHAARA
jgi:hypothetical protein